MAEILISSLKKLVRDKHALEERARQAAAVERRLITHWSQVLARTGYRLLPVGGDHLQAAGRKTRQGRARVKRLRCPKCDRRFAYALHMARHMSATHGPKRHRSAKRK